MEDMEVLPPCGSSLSLKCVASPTLGGGSSQGPWRHVGVESREVEGRRGNWLRQEGWIPVTAPSRGTTANSRNRGRAQPIELLLFLLKSECPSPRSRGQGSTLNLGDTVQSVTAFRLISESAVCPLCPPHEGLHSQVQRSSLSP